MLPYRVKQLTRALLVRVGRGEGAEDLPSDVALEAGSDFLAGLALGPVALDLASIHRWAFGCQRDVVCALRFVWGRG